MGYLICQKHNKIEQAGSKVPINCYICLNRICTSAFKIFCSACKNQHRDHLIKVLSLEDITFLTDRLLKTPFKQVANYVSQTVDVMKKLKLIKQFKKKIDAIQKEIHYQALKLIQNTQMLIHEYAVCKSNVTDLAEVLERIEEPAFFENFQLNSKEYMNNLQYNFNKDKFQFGNNFTREKQEKRKRSYDNSRRKIEEVKDYTMKIIEVILHNNDSQDEQQDIAYTKKHYDLLKKEVCSEKIELQLESEVSNMKNSRSTVNKSRIKKDVTEKQSQTEDEMLSREEATEQIQEKINQMRSSHVRTENDLRLKISIVAKQKENTNREITKIKLKYQDKKRQILKLQQSLRKNLLQRQQKQRQRQNYISKIIQLSQWRGLSLEDHYQ